MTAALWTLQEVLAAVPGKLIGTAKDAFTGVSIDSRTIKADEIYVAIKGERLDGHDFAAAALKAGAGLAFVSRYDDDMGTAGAVLVVDDPLEALRQLATAARARSTARIIAVTGSVGKTSSKELLRLALGANGPTHASVASFNNHWGVPLSLARLPREAAFGVFEIGMNHTGEITPLSRLVKPHIAMITTIAESHLGQFNSLDDIAVAKAEIFAGLMPDGIGVIGADTPYFSSLCKAAEAAGAKTVIGFGRHQQADSRLENLVLHNSCCCVSATVLQEAVTFKLGVTGEHMAVNATGVLAIAKLAGADLARAALALADFSAAKGRGEQFRFMLADGVIQVIDESYNANPASMQAALAVLGAAKISARARRIAVLGDMLELGVQSPKLHAGLKTCIDRYGIDKVFVAGEQMRHLWECLTPQQRGGYAATVDELSQPFLGFIRAGDVIMIKGSRGCRMDRLIDQLHQYLEAVPEAQRSTG